MNLEQHIMERCEGKDFVRAAREINELFGTEYTRHSLRHKYNRLKEATMKKKTALPESLERDRKIDQLSQSKKVTDSKYKEARDLIAKLERERDAVKVIQKYNEFSIKPKLSSGKSESTVVVLASDWHVEEDVQRAATNGLNEYNLQTARWRAEEFFRSTLRLIQIFQKDTQIDNLVLALLGDFISGNIHDDIAENNNLGATEALIFAEELLISGIQFLLDNSELNIIVPCHSGNHARTTKEQRMATENANSFEYYMYHVMAKHFAGNKRVKFMISESYVSYLPVYNYTIRFHHGHGMRYGGGVGGLFIPAYKAISRWNDGRRADIDCFGHFHQFRDGGSFICNGSLIGYNAYAVAGGFSYEAPKQVMFVIERERGRTFTVPISFKH